MYTYIVNKYLHLYQYLLKLIKQSLSWTNEKVSGLKYVYS
jgi:hypothetical protein